MKTTNSCLNCGKEDNRTGKPCPTRSGCFTPDYKSWEPIVEADPKNPNWEIDHFTYSKKDDYMIFTLQSETNGTMLVELTPDEIASFANNH